MKWRKWIRITHRDIGYLSVGLIIIYSISGIAVNHVNDWNPNYNISQSVISIKANPDTTLSQSAMAQYVLNELREKDSVISSFKSSPSSIQIFFEGKSIKANIKVGKAELEIVKNKAILRETNFLHLNVPKKLWTYIADAFAVGLIFLSISGLFMIKGKKGIKGRGMWLTLAGVLIPVIFLILYF